MANIEYIIYNIKHKMKVRKYKKLYPDYEDNEYNCGLLKHIWGVKSGDDLSGKECNFYTMNDIDVTYDRDSKLYIIGVETAYIFDNKKNKCKYLRRLLDLFTEFMEDNNYSKDYELCLSTSRPPSILTSAESIEELYIKFKIYVEGYCKVYNS